MSLCAKFHTFVPICAMVQLTALTIRNLARQTLQPLSDVCYISMEATFYFGGGKTVLESLRSVMNPGNTPLKVFNRTPPAKGSFPLDHDGWYPFLVHIDSLVSNDVLPALIH